MGTLCQPIRWPSKGELTSPLNDTTMNQIFDDDDKCTRTTLNQSPHKTHDLI